MDCRRLPSLAFAAVLAFGQALPAAGQAPSGPRVGEAAPAFELPTVDGRHVSLAGLRGKTVVINAWATWCPPCRLETPDLMAAYRRLAGPGVVFVGVDSTEGAPLVKAFVAAKGVRWVQAVDPGRTFARAYDVRYFPTTWVIDPQGILRTVYVDVMTPELLAGFVADAQASRNGRIASPLQTKIDALLAPAQYPLDGDEAAIVANVEKIRKAIDAAEEATGDADPFKGNPVDIARTQAQEETLRAAAIRALAPLAAGDAAKFVLSLMRGDSSWYRGAYAEALDAYRAASALDPKDADALGGIAQSARRLKDYDEMLRADEALAALDPADVENLVQLGIDCGAAGRFARGREAFERALALQSKKAAAAHPKPAEIRTLAWIHLYYGRMEAKAHETARACRQFALAAKAALRLPKSDSRYAIYLEQAQEETVALDLGAARVATALSLAPWTGPELPGSVPNTLKYRLVVAGRGGARVALRAADLPAGWIASFCTDRICAPLRVTTSLPTGGVKVIEFQVVPPTAAGLAHAPPVRVVGTDGRTSASARTL